MSAWDAWLAMAVCAIAGGAAFAWLYRWYASVVGTTARSKAVKREFASYNRGRAPGAELFATRDALASRFKPTAERSVRSHDDSR